MKGTICINQQKFSAKYPQRSPQIQIMYAAQQSPSPESQVLLKLSRRQETIRSSYAFHAFFFYHSASWTGLPTRMNHLQAITRIFSMNTTIFCHVVYCCSSHSPKYLHSHLQFCSAILKSCSWHGSYRSSVADGWCADGLRNWFSLNTQDVVSANTSRTCFVARSTRHSRINVESGSVSLDIVSGIPWT
jgi:hypothetical protein